MTQHAPVYCKNTDSKGLVIFIHGFMGSPVQFACLIDAVHKQGYSTATLLLPGHGGSAAKFASGTYECWQNYVDNEIEQFSKDYDRILLVGHSMGGLLAINTSVKQSKNVCGIFMIACPFIVTKVSTYAIKIRLKQAFSRKSNPIKAAYLNSSSVSLSPNLLWSTIKPSMELKKLMHVAGSNLPKVTAPITAVYSSADELTSIKSLEILKNELHKSLLTEVLISDSLHAYYPEKEQSIIEESLIKALDSLA